MTINSNLLCTIPREITFSTIMPHIDGVSFLKLRVADKATRELVKQYLASDYVTQEHKNFADNLISIIVKKSTRLEQIPYHLVINLAIKFFKANPCKEFNIAIRLAATKGDIKIITELLQDHRTDPSEAGNYSLARAVFAKDKAVIKELLKDQLVRNGLKNQTSLIQQTQNAIGKKSYSEIINKPAVYHA